MPEDDAGDSSEERGRSNEERSGTNAARSDASAERGDATAERTGTDETWLRVDRSDPAATVRSVLTVVLVFGLVVALLATGYVAVNPPETGKPYTELYLLNDEDVAADYETNLTVGEEGTVHVGVVNQEQEPVEYHLVVRDGERTVAERTFEVAYEQTHREPITFSFQETGPKRLDVELYRDGPPDGDAEPYRRNRLLVLVSDGG